MHTPCASATTYDSISVSFCDSYTAPSGVQYTISGVFNDTIQNAAGCDSIITIDLIISYSSYTFINTRTCGEPYLSDAGNVYPSTGTYIENYSTINDCDSIVTLEVEIGLPHDNWPSVTACDEYVSDAGIIYNVSGVYQESFLD